MTMQPALGFNGGQANDPGQGQSPAQPVSPEQGGAQAVGAAQYVTLDDAKRMVQEAVADALRQAQSHTDKSVAHLSEQFAAKPQPGSAQPVPATQPQTTQVEGTISPERIEWANKMAAEIYNRFGVALTGEDDDAPFRALLDESTPEAFIKSLPAAVVAKSMARQQAAPDQPPANPAARAPALSSGGMATRSDPQYSDIPDLYKRGLEQPLPRKR